MLRCGGVILAAGESTRLGQAKQLLPLDGWPMVARVAATALATRCSPVVVVLGCEAEEVRRALPRISVHTVVNSEWRTGMASSVKAGLSSLEVLEPNLDAILMLACDQPLVSAGDIDRLLTEHEAGGLPIAAAAYNGTIGVPAVFARPMFVELRALCGARGAGALIRSNQERVQPVAMPSAALDVDTLSDYRCIRRALTVLHSQRLDQRAKCT